MHGILVCKCCGHKGIVDTATGKYKERLVFIYQYSDPYNTCKCVDCYYWYLRNWRKPRYIESFLETYLNRINSKKRYRVSRYGWRLKPEKRSWLCLNKILSE